MDKRRQIDRLETNLPCKDGHTTDIIMAFPGFLSAKTLTWQ